MAKGNNATPPQEPTRPLVDGGATEKSQLDWVLRSQSNLLERIISIETHNEYSANTQDRIEKLLIKQQEYFEQQFIKFAEMQDKQFDKHCLNQEKLFDRSLAAQEKAIDIQRVELIKNTDAIVKINRMLAYAAGAIAAGILVAGFIINGQLGKLSTFMEQQKESQNITKDAPK